MDELFARLDAFQKDFDEFKAETSRTNAGLAELIVENEFVRSQVPTDRTVTPAVAFQEVSTTTDGAFLLESVTGQDTAAAVFPRHQPTKDVGVVPTLLDIKDIIKQEVQKQLKALYEQIATIPGIPRPMEKEPDNGYEASPFVETIAGVEFPKGFIIPDISSYDGTDDPNDHVSIFKQKMMTVSIPGKDREAIMCKCFGATLEGPALRWFLGLPRGSVESFANLIDLFKVQFISSRRLEKYSNDLY